MDTVVELVTLVMVERSFVALDIAYKTWLQYAWNLNWSVVFLE